jgi:TPR repeat protein
MCSSGTDADAVKALEYYKIAANRGQADAFAM